MSQDVDEALSKGYEFYRKAQRARGKAFTAGIINLLALLKEWEDDDPSMSFSLDILHFHTYNRRQELTMERSKKQSGLTGGFSYDRYRSIELLLQLGSLDNLPKLKKVLRLHIYDTYGMRMAPDAMARLATNFSALTTLHLELSDMHWNDNWDGELESKIRYGMLRFSIS